RRRHTRCLSDWSSDVCSSDLTKKKIERTVRNASPKVKSAVSKVEPPVRIESEEPIRVYRATMFRFATVGSACSVVSTLNRDRRRSEERRVGKEGRSREGRAQ